MSEFLNRAIDDGTSALADEVARRAARITAYLRELDARKLVTDAEDAARRAPLSAAALGLVAGLAASRLLKARPPSS